MALEFETKFELQARLSLVGVTEKLSNLRGEMEHDRVHRIQIRYGKDRSEFGEIFQVRKVGTTDEIHWLGQTERLDDLGSGLVKGKWHVHGDCGDRAGASMSGGRLEISGSTGHWLGANSQGGTILVQGNAGDYAASSTPGQSRGINGCCIIIDGNAGEMTGRRMRRGILAVVGCTGAGTGWQMLAGTILLGKACNGPVGKSMKRGTIIALEKTNSGSVLPPSTFYPGLTLRQPCWPLISRHLVEAGFRGELLPNDQKFSIFHGDPSFAARGEVWIPEGNGRA